MATGSLEKEGPAYKLETVSTLSLDRESFLRDGERP